MAVGLRITNPLTGHSRDFHSGNISSSGVFVETSDYYGLHDNVSVEVFLLADTQERLPRHRHVSVKGDVVRQETGGFAVRFHEKFRLV